MQRNIVILGSTGSIGQNALRVAEHLGAQIRVVGLAAGRHVELLAVQARRFRCEWAALAAAEPRERLRGLLPPGCRAACGEDLCELVSAPGVDLVLCAISGTAGLGPVLAAIGAGKCIALASKEVLVMAGELVLAQAARCGVRILPVDSEHSALFQCLEGRRADEVRRLILTASGGPFRRSSVRRLAKVTPAEALAHPTWHMGPKITIDSATLMNKGLELIEAHWLFGMPANRLDVVIHPQSIVHSMVELVDGGILAHMGPPDMRLPIQYALTYPERSCSPVKPVDFGQTLRLEFEAPDHRRFPAIQLARQALATGGTMPAVLNAANEAAVERFCSGVLGFTDIWRVVGQVMERHQAIHHPTLAQILAADTWARQMVTDPRTA